MKSVKIVLINTPEGNEIHGVFDEMVSDESIEIGMKEAYSDEIHFEICQEKIYEKFIT